MTDEGPWEYKLDVVQIAPPGALSSETDDIFVQSWYWTGERANVPSGRFTLTKSADSLSIAHGDEFKYYRRLAGEPFWGGPLALGYVFAKEQTDTAIIFRLHGILHKLKCRDITSMDYGANHTVDRLLPVTRTSIAGTPGKLGRTYAIMAPATTDAQMERVQILRSTNYTSSGFNPILAPGLVSAMNKPGNVEDQAVNFIANDGPLQFMWVRITHNLDLITPQFVEVTLQQDVGGRPSGAPIDGMMIDANLIPGFGVWAWWKIDFLNLVTNENNLMLERGMQYWIVFQVIGVDAGTSISFSARDDPAPHARVTIHRVNALLWTLNQMKCMRYMIAQEGDWFDLEEYDMRWCGDMGGGYVSVQIFFQRRTDVQIGDSGGFGNVAGISPTMMFDGQELCRVSYWSGFVSFGTVLMDWAYDWAVDLFDTLTVIISSPLINYEVIHVENDTAWSVFAKFREVLPITIWLEEDDVGVRTMYIVDEVDVTGWAGLTVPEKAVRTYSHGHDTLVDDEVRLRVTRYLEEIIKETHAVVIASNNDGNVWGAYGDTTPATTPGTGLANRDLTIGGDGDGLEGGGSWDGGISTTEKQWDVTRQLRKSVSLTLSGFDQSITALVYRHPNELIKLTDTMRGIPTTVFAVQSFRWSSPKGDMASLSLQCADIIFDIIPTMMKSGAAPPGHGPARPNVNANDMDLREQGFTSLIRDLVEPFTPSYRQIGEGLGSGLTLSPRTIRSKTGFQMKSTYTILHHEVGTTVDPTKIWWIRLGTGIPAGSTLGNQVCEVMAVNPLPVVGVAGVMLCAHFVRADLGFRAAIPAVFTEIGIAWSNTEVDVKNPSQAWTLGPGSQIDQNPVQMNSTNRVAVVLRFET